MEYVYAALLLHKAGKEVDEEGIKKIISAAGAEVDESKAKSLVASLKGVDIEAELANAVVATASPTTSGEGNTEKPVEEAPKEEKKEEAAEGLSALFG